MLKRIAHISSSWASKVATYHQTRTHQAHHDILSRGLLATRHQEVGLMPDAVSDASLANAWRQKQWRRALSLGDRSFVIA